MLAGIAIAAACSDASGPATPASVEIEPAVDSVGVDDVTVLTAFVRDAHGTLISAPLIWDHRQPSVSFIEPLTNGGLQVTGRARGTDTITVQTGSVEGAAVLTVTSPISVELSAPAFSIADSIPNVTALATADVGTVDTVQFQVDGSPWMTPVTAPLPTDITSISGPVPGLPAGTHDVRLRVVGSTHDVASRNSTLTLGAAQTLEIAEQLGAISGTPVVGATTTRGALAKAFVHFYGAESAAQSLQGTACFTDVAGTPDNGEICQLQSIAQSAGATLGLPDGSFHPDTLATVGTVVQWIDALLSIPRDTSLKEPTSDIAALSGAGLLPPDVTTQQLTGSANQPVGVGLATELIYQAWVRFQLPGGRTPAQTYIDPGWRRW